MGKECMEAQLKEEGSSGPLSILGGIPCRDAGPIREADATRGRGAGIGDAHWCGSAGGWDGGMVGGKRLYWAENWLGGGREGRCCYCGLQGRLLLSTLGLWTATGSAMNGTASKPDGEANDWRRPTLFN